MIIIDVSAISHLMLNIIKDDGVTIDLMRQLMLFKIGSILDDVNCNKDEEVILAWDSNSWRKKYNVHYKANRKKSREKNNKVDYENFYDIMNKLFIEFTENIGYKCIMCSGAEGDDIIYVMRDYIQDGRCVIVSRDKDLRQVCVKYKNTTLYDPSSNARKIENRFTDYSDYNLFEHIIKGDASDGIPNVLSPISTFVDGVRQVTLSQKKRLDLLEHEFNLIDSVNVDDDVLTRIEENSTLIDMSNIPNNIYNDIIIAYNEYKLPSKSPFVYLMSNKLNKIIDKKYYR